MGDRQTNVYLRLQQLMDHMSFVQNMILAEFGETFSSVSGRIYFPVSSDARQTILKYNNANWERFIGIIVDEINFDDTDIVRAQIEVSAILKRCVTMNNINDMNKISGYAVGVSFVKSAIAEKQLHLDTRMCSFYKFTHKFKNIVINDTQVSKQNWGLVHPDLRNERWDDEFKLLTKYGPVAT